MPKQNKIRIGIELFIILLVGFILIFNWNIPGFNSITGMPVGIAQVNVLQVAQITLVTNNVNFGNITAGGTDNTTDNNPVPFLIRNDGSVEVNFTIARDVNSTPLFNGTGGGDNTSSFQFAASVAGEGVPGNPACSTITWTNVPGTDPIVAVCEFNYVDTNDEVQIELLINPPGDEPAGLKSENLVFTAYES
ncbi:MAG: hypothetical protein ABIF40_03825 [archaeon]